MRKLQRIDLVVIPRRGKKRVYAIGPLTVGHETFDYIEGMVFSFEQKAKKYAAPVPRRSRRMPFVFEVDGIPVPIKHLHD